MTLLAIVPWVVVCVILLAIIVVRRPTAVDEEEEEYIAEGSRQIIRVAVYDENAYWVYDNVLYISEVTREPDFETARPLDVSKLSDEQVEKVFNILDELESYSEGE